MGRRPEGTVGLHLFLAKAGKKLDELAATLARGKTRRGRDTPVA
jgi:hypothetical protein